MKNHGDVSIRGLIAAVFVLTLGQTIAAEDPPGRPMAYVVCGDDHAYDYDKYGRVYRVDLLAGILQKVSNPIDWVGNPQHLSFDPVYSRLYIASMRGRSYDYWPVTVVQVNNGVFEVVGRFSTAADDTLPRGAGEARKRESGESYRSHLNTKVREAYESVVSPDGKELYVMHGGLADTGHLSAVWDSETGEVLRLLPTSIRPSHLWSPDGKRVAAIWPSGERTRHENGQERTRTWPGGVSVIDVQTGVRVTNYLEENQGMHPPWSKVYGPYIRVHGSGLLRAYDRDTGDVISEFNVMELTGLTTHYGGILWSQPPVLDDRQSIILNMRCYERTDDRNGTNCLWPTYEELPNIIEHTYLVVIDALRQIEISRSEVGTDCSNPVLGYE